MTVGSGMEQGEGLEVKLLTCRSAASGGCLVLTSLRPPGELIDLKSLCVKDSFFMIRNDTWLNEDLALSDS